MSIKETRKKPIDKHETIFEESIRLRAEAIAISKNFNHVKPIKYLLK